MKGFVLPAVVALAFTASTAITWAEDAKPAAKQATAQPAGKQAAAQPADTKASDQIIQQLTPPAGTPPLRAEPVMTGRATASWKRSTIRK